MANIQFPTAEIENRRGAKEKERKKTVTLEVLRRIRGFTTMRYINLRFTYLLTYLLTY